MPTGASRLGGLSYKEEIETRRSLLPNASKYETPSINMIPQNRFQCKFFCTNEIDLRNMKKLDTFSQIDYTK